MQTSNAFILELEFVIQESFPPTVLENLSNCPKLTLFSVKLQLCFNMNFVGKI